MSTIQESIDQYLDAVEQVYGAEYRQQTEVFASSHYVTIKHPGAPEGDAIPVGHLDLMTEHLLHGDERATV